MPKQIISPGQALLLLIDAAKDQPMTNELKEFYLCGANNYRQLRKIESFFKHQILSDYEISYTNETITNDPTRRYFETHLAYETLKNNLCKIDVDDLISNQSALLSLFNPHNVPAIGDLINDVMNGKFKDGDSDYEKEHACYISKLKKNTLFSQFSEESREKIELLVKNVFLGVINATDKMPLDIYGIGLFSRASRGKKELDDQETTRNQHLGLMKGHMPLPLNDLAKAEETFPFLKPSDKSTFIQDAEWVDENFRKLVHPFSNSISGTMLAQLRVLTQLKRKKITIFTKTAEKMARYIQLFCAARLFHSGGHSLNEFIAPLNLPDVMDNFDDIPGFEEITLKSLYLTNNEQAFDQALVDSIAYNKMIIARKRFQLELVEGVASSILTKLL